MAEDQDDIYQVGYGEPPKHSQFKPGKSPNPGGRPEGSKSCQSFIEAELSGDVDLKEQGVVPKVTKMEALAKRLIADALAEDPKALGELLRQINLHLAEAPRQPSKNLPASEDDARLLLKYAQRTLKAHSIEGGDQ